MPYYIYILQSELDGSYYVGSTKDLDERLHQYTKAKRPWKLVYYEEFPDKSSALKRECQIKRRKDRVFIESLVRTSRP
jgi:putative endonuclease